jgi:hypothetical protein
LSTNEIGITTILRDGVSSQTLTFAATLLDITNNSSLINLGYVIVEANWGGKKRWAYIACGDQCAEFDRDDQTGDTLRMLFRPRSFVRRSGETARRETGGVARS